MVFQKSNPFPTSVYAAVAYQVTHPEEKDHTNVDRADWIFHLEEVLAKAIAQIILARQSESR
jgi:ABC-type phosphate transport system ATPase subunit